MVGTAVFVGIHEDNYAEAGFESPAHLQTVEPRRR